MASIQQPKRELWRESTVVGTWFLGLDNDGKPVAAGRIARGLGRGQYVVTYHFLVPGAESPPVVSIEDVAELGWRLFDNVELWQQEYERANT